MIYIERVVTIKNNEALIDEQIILYKGDRNVEVQFTLKNNPFKDKNRVNKPQRRTSSARNSST